MSRRRPRGQSAVETAVAIAAIVVMFAGAVKIWSWVDQTMVHRQEKFQETRQKAGTFAFLEKEPVEKFAFGMPVPYEWEPLELFTKADLKDSKLKEGMPPPVCEPGMALMEQAEALTEQANALVEQAEQIELTEAQPITDELKRLADEWTRLGCDADPDDDDCEDLADEIERLTNRLEPIQRRIDALYRQAEALYNQARALQQQAVDLCGALYL